MEHILDKDVERVLFSEEELKNRVAEMRILKNRDMKLWMTHQLQWKTGCIIVIRIILTWEWWQVISGMMIIPSWKDILIVLLAKTK